MKNRMKLETNQKQLIYEEKNQIKNQIKNKKIRKTKKNMCEEKSIESGEEFPVLWLR